MYSVEPDKEGTPRIVEHRLPWDKNNKYSAPKFQKLEARGYTFDRPVLEVSGVPILSVPQSSVAVLDNPELTCTVCGKTCESKLGLTGHMRSHKT
jgi:hypothetical protein